MDPARGFKVKRTNPYTGLIIVNVGLMVLLVLVGGLYMVFRSEQSDAGQDAPVATAVVVEREPSVPMIEILVPLRAIEPGETLTPALFKKELRSETSVTERMVRDFSEIADSYARAAILPGDPLNRDYITNQKPLNQITTNIPDGFRAVTVAVDVKTGVEGWARAGARVDVGWTSPASDGGKAIFALVAQNVLVLSAERQVTPDQNTNAPVPATITLLVNAKDSAKIQLAQATGGVITLSLRGDKDTGRDAGFSAITSDDLAARSAPNGEETVEGIVRFRDPITGKYKELIVKNGRLVKK
jgi:Flp pilus assembly protein CpaB